MGVGWAHFTAHVLLVGVPKRPTIMPRLIYIPNPIQKIPWSLIGDHEPFLDYPRILTNRFWMLFYCKMASN